MANFEERCLWKQKCARNVILVQTVNVPIFPQCDFRSNAHTKKIIFLYILHYIHYITFKWKLISATQYCTATYSIRLIRLILSDQIRGRYYYYLALNQISLARLYLNRDCKSWKVTTNELSSFDERSSSCSLGWIPVISACCYALPLPFHPPFHSLLRLTNLWGKISATLRSSNSRSQEYFK